MPNYNPDSYRDKLRNSTSFRINSIDILRSFTMLLMIFVNDLWTLKDIPLWLEHTAAEADGMGLADTVFPAFLFLVGMSIPLSVAQRQAKGDSLIRLLIHVIERSVALLIMGLFLMNGENLNEAATGMSKAAWYSISCISFILLWNSWPKTMQRWLVWLLKLIAIAALTYMAWICRGSEGGEVQGFAHYWWGILGLIGWAYFVTAIIFVLCKGNPWVCPISWLLFLTASVCSHSGLIPSGSLLQIILSPLGDGAMPAFTMGGVLTTLIVLHYRKKNKIGMMMIVLGILVVLLLMAGFYLRGFWGISKIRATPAWVLICSAITIAIFIPLYWLTDIKGRGDWFKIIRPAGTNTLLCYLLPYLAYSVAGVSGVFLPAILLTGTIGLLKSFLFAMLIILITGGLGKTGVRLRL